MKCDEIKYEDFYKKWIIDIVAPQCKCDVFRSSGINNNTNVTISHTFETGTNTAKTLDDDKGSIGCRSEDRKANKLGQSPVTLCNLGVGATFGESILHDLPRDSTVVTKTTCELLRVEQQDFRLIWETPLTFLRSHQIDIDGLLFASQQMRNPSICGHKKSSSLH
uniref:Cyclic nucleotide-binding domain-containing protein n=1 Tax=Glossina austeni TaxID=7395 RepID=A0A1A9VI13_GLOAU